VQASGEVYHGSRFATQSYAASNFRRKGRASVGVAIGRCVLNRPVLFILLFEHAL